MVENTQKSVVMVVLFLNSDYDEVKRSKGGTGSHSHIPSVLLIYLHLSKEKDGSDIPAI